MEQYYSIAGSVIKVTSDADNKISMFNGFETKETDDIIMDCEILSKDNTCSCYSISHIPVEAAYPHMLLPEHGSKYSNRIVANSDWSKVKIYGKPDRSIAWMEMLVTAFYSRLTAYGGLLMHASAVSYKGSVVVFTAASGIGKTTQAELWKQHMGAEILNGDKVFLRQQEDRIDAWGSPWSGSSPYAVNLSAPLKAIVVLAQGDRNVIRRLESFELLAMFPPHVFLPVWDKKCLDSVMQVLDQIISEIPVYYLCCRPDEEAVLLTRDTIWQGE